MAEIPIPAINDLAEYLLAHEADIAQGVNDFATLRKVFRVVMGRTAGGL